jgi:ADP-heptose:LPS heptosyltransferase
LWPEQGIGDEIMFSSIIPDLQAQCSKLIVQADKRLIPIFKRSFSENIDFWPSNKVVPETEYDAHIPIGSLPLQFRQTTDSFKSISKGWLSACNAKVSSLRKKLLADGIETVIGISWHSTNPKIGARYKLISLTQLAEKLDKSTIKLVNLQYGEVNDELDKLSQETGIKVYQVPEIDNKNDLDGLASLIMACDKVVSISNVTIHLAGALGKEAHVLLAPSGDWRWGKNPDRSHWYDSVHLHRQTKINDWMHVLNFF